MNKALGITGWVVAVIAIIGIGCYIRHTDKLTTALEQARTEVETTALKLDTVRQQLQRVADATPEPPAAQNLETLEASLAKANEELTQLKATSELAAFAASAFGEVKEDKGPTNPVLKMMAEMGQNEEMMAMQAKMAVNMQYGALLRDLALPADVTAQMKDILAEASMEQMKVGMAMATGEDAMTGTEMKNLQETGTDWARTELSKILTAEEMATWEDFEENKAQHMMEQSYDMQLGMFAIGLTDENKTMLRDVLVEEAMLLQDAAMDSVEAFDMAGQMLNQLTIIETTRERIFPALNEEQYAIADSFLEQQETQFRAMAEMMSGMFDREEGDNTDVPSPVEIPAEPLASSSTENE